MIRPLLHLILIGGAFFLFSYGFSSISRFHNFPPPLGPTVRYLAVPLLLLSVETVIAPRRSLRVLAAVLAVSLMLTTSLFLVPDTV